MEIKTTDMKVLEYFFENPYKEVYLRDLAKKIHVSVFAAKKSLDKLVKEGILLERREGKLRYIKANVENPFFKHLKIAFNIKKILDSGILEYLKKNIHPLLCIVLFGSVAKGEDDEKSDIDLLVIGNEKNNLFLSKFEKRLNKEINLIIMKWHEWRKKAEKDKAFYLDVISYGIPLYGDLPVIE